MLIFFDSLESVCMSWMCGCLNPLLQQGGGLCDMKCLVNWPGFHQGELSQISINILKQHKLLFFLHFDVFDVGILFYFS